jgi:hypothetical protein
MSASLCCECIGRCWVHQRVLAWQRQRAVGSSVVPVSVGLAGALGSTCTGVLLTVHHACAGLMMRCCVRVRVCTCR